jgi:hypothetical protein
MVKRKIPIPRRELNPRTLIIQPVAQRYTDWAITALIKILVLRFSWRRCFKSSSLWVVTSCSVLVGYQRFRCPWCLHLGIPPQHYTVSQPIRPEPKTNQDTWIYNMIFYNVNTVSRSVRNTSYILL